jgi:menaquinone-dependent protoporphyrinogen IX oxidase
MVESDQEYARLGNSVGSAGDVDGDGYDDVIIGAPLYDGEYGDSGAAFIYRGSAWGLGEAPVVTLTRVIDYAYRCMDLSRG